MRDGTLTADAEPMPAGASRAGPTGDRLLDAETGRAYLRRCSRLIARHAPLLTRLDTALGDGDHGDNLVAGFSAVDDELDADGLGPGGDLASLLQQAGTTLVTSVGGASGPLYGAAFVEAGFAARSLTGVEKLPALVGLLETAAAAIARRGHCAVGDKTIYDTLAPAAAALRDAVARGDDEAAALRAMLRAGARGMRGTTALVARRGLALRLGEASRGHRDPGAVSCLLLLCALLADDGREH